MTSSTNEGMTKFDESNIIEYDWPKIYVPRTSLSRYLVEKFLFFSNQVFLIDGENGTQFTYKHVLVDSLKCAQVLRENNVSSNSTVAIIGSNCYEYVCTLFACFLLEASIVLLDSKSRPDQISSVIKKCSISYVAVVMPKTEKMANNKQIEMSDQQYKRSYRIQFGESTVSPKDDNLNNNIQNYPVFHEKAINSKYLGLRRSARQNNWERIRVIIPQLKGAKVRRLISINEHSLMSQLTYATLPKSGFEWIINDIVLNMFPFGNLLGILELLTSLSVGARFVFNRNDKPMEVEHLAKLVERHSITASLLHSTYLVELIKNKVRLNTLEKIVYTEQPIHRNIVNVFKKMYNVHNCRYGHFALEASGFAAIEVSNSTPNECILVAPLPSMQIIVVERYGNRTCSNGQIGKIFIRSPFCAQTSQRTMMDGWMYSGYVGFYDDHRSMQVIDHYHNFIRMGHRFISKTLIETILLSQQTVARAVALKTIGQTLNGKGKQFRTLVTLKDGNNTTNSEELEHYLNAQLNDNNMKWSVTIVRRLIRDGQYRIRLMRCDKRRQMMMTRSN